MPYHYSRPTFKHCSECGTDNKDPKFPMCRDCHLSAKSATQARIAAYRARRDAEERERARLAAEAKAREQEIISQERANCYICKGGTVGKLCETIPPLCRFHKHDYGHPVCTLCDDVIPVLGSRHNVWTCISCKHGLDAMEFYICHDTDKFHELPSNIKDAVVPGFYLEVSSTIDGMSHTYWFHLPKVLVPYVGHTCHIYPADLKHELYKKLMWGTTLSIFNERVVSMRVVRGEPPIRPSFEAMLANPVTDAPVTVAHATDAPATTDAE